MLKTGKIAVLAIFGLLLINPAFAEDKSAAMVNGVSIPQARIDMRVKDAVAQGQADTPDLRKAIREQMINIEVLSQAAKKDGLDKTPDVVEQTQLAKDSVLVSAYVQNYAKSHPITDDQLKQEYDKLKARLGDKEYKVSHILVGTEAEAKAIIAELGKKGNFAKIAKEKSKDAGSAPHGGELGWAVPSNYVPPFADAMIALKKGSYTQQPVQTQFGWHVIKMDDIRPLKVPTFEEVKPQIQQRLQQEAIQGMIADLRSKAKIE
jgi:peptidyl-prolyl cis-trans isomerase C